ncbi:MAG: type IX secretion system protein PorQ [Saprospiraceae bacterium]|nr:type IX secretion system protein PorQ [Saprospiraceae bacterium]
MMNQDIYKKKWFAIPAGVIRSGRRSSGILFLLVSCITAAWSQRGGEQVFEFVKLPTSARATALGGSQIAAATNDYGLIGGNPGMLNITMDNSFVFQHNFHFAGIDNGYAGFAKYIPGMKSMIHGGVHYLSYGKFIAADQMGNIEGEFKAKDLSINAGISKELNERMTAGVQLQYIQSTLETYTSNGLLFDGGITYRSEDGFNHYALVLRGVGFQFSRYYEGDEKGRMPVDFQFGFSKRLKYVPFRLSILMHDINRWDLRYTSPLDEETSDDFGGEAPSEPSDFGQSVDNFFKHLTFGGEFLIGKKESLMLRLGYNYQRHQELSVVNLRSLAGFSAGVGINVKSFILDYGFAIYHQAGSSKHLGLRVNLNDLKRKKIVD